MDPQVTRADIVRVDGRLDVIQAIMEERSGQLLKAFEAAEQSRKAALNAYPTKEDFNKLSEQVIVLRAVSDRMVGSKSGSFEMGDVFWKALPILISLGVLIWEFTRVRP